MGEEAKFWVDFSPFLGSTCSSKEKKMKARLKSFKRTKVRKSKTLTCFVHWVLLV